MQQTQDLVNEIREYCAAHRDPVLAAKYSRYFREGYDAWGLMSDKLPLWTEKQPEWFERYRGLGLKGFLKAGELLFVSGKYEEGALAIRFVKQFLPQFHARTFEALSGWFKAGIRNWAHTDVLCSEVISPLIAQGQIELQTLARWRGSSYKYQRRAVPVGMLGLLKKSADVEPLLEVIEPLMMDPERVVQQGLGWFVREAWKKQPRRVEAFLTKWKDRAPRLIFQYATEKMTPATRARFRAPGRKSKAAC